MLMFAYVFATWYYRKKFTNVIDKKKKNLKLTLFIVCLFRLILIKKIVTAEQRKQNWLNHVNTEQNIQQ